MGQLNQLPQNIPLTRAEAHTMLLIIGLAIEVAPALEGQTINGQLVDKTFLDALGANIQTLQSKMLPVSKGEKLGKNYKRR